MRQHAEAGVRKYAGPVWARLLVGAIAVMAASGLASAAEGASTNAPATSVTVAVSDPVMRQPAPEVLLDIARREKTELVNRGTQEALDARMKESVRPKTVEESGGAVRHVKRVGVLRGVADLFDPFAPVPKPYSAANSAFEKRRPIDHHLPASLRSEATPAIPRTHIDPITHEYGLRLW